MVQAGRNEEVVMDWKLYAGGGLVIVAIAGIWLYLRYKAKAYKWLADYLRSEGRKEERLEANEQARKAQDQAEANAENARVENSNLPIGNARQRARRKWRKDDVE